MISIEDYILKNYLDSKLLTGFEKLELDLFNSVSNYEFLQSNYPNLNSDALKKRYNITDEIIEKYNSERYKIFRFKLAKRILKDYEKEIFINHCPICGQLARTPTTQRGICGHTWDNYNLILDEDGKRKWMKI